MVLHLMMRVNRELLEEMHGNTNGTANVEHSSTRQFTVTVSLRGLLVSIHLGKTVSEVYRRQGTKKLFFRPTFT